MGCTISPIFKTHRVRAVPLHRKVLDETGRRCFNTFVGRPHPIQDHAIDNLRYIRDTMERVSNLTAVPGYGGMVMGGTALVAAGIASRVTTNREWLAIWLTELVLAVAIGSLPAQLKTQACNAVLRHGSSLL